MLWAFFDESGWHAPRSEGGGLKKLTIGGCISSFDSWECLALEWASALKAMNVEVFHMVDFEGRKKPPYDAWSNDEREARLNALLNIIGRKGRDCYGFTNYFRPDDTTSSIYERCVHDLFVHMGAYDDQITLVFSDHPEYGRHQEILNKMAKYGLGLNISIRIGWPVDNCPLQVADLIAYEIRCEERLERPTRYPLKRLASLGCTFRSSGAVE
jgi:hypothetical protein